MNDSGSNAPGVGINTSDYDPKADDWSRDVRSLQASAQLGQTVTNVEFIQGADVNDQASFVQTAAPVAPGAPLVAGTINRTGKTVPSGSWAWGTTTVA